jgi:hypothetical protein
MLALGGAHLHKYPEQQWLRFPVPCHNHDSVNQAKCDMCVAFDVAWEQEQQRQQQQQLYGPSSS